MNDSALARVLYHDARCDSPCLITAARVRYWIGAVASILVAYHVAAFLHEFTHVAQAWIQTGQFHFDIDWNPTFNASICGGHYACAGGDRLVDTGFWAGEGIAYFVTAVVLVPTYLFLLPRFTGVRHP